MIPLEKDSQTHLPKAAGEKVAEGVVGRPGVVILSDHEDDVMSTGGNSSASNSNANQNNNTCSNRNRSNSAASSSATSATAVQTPSVCASVSTTTVTTNKEEPVRAVSPLGGVQGMAMLQQQQNQPLPNSSNHSLSSNATFDQSLYTSMSENDNSDVSFGCGDGVGRGTGGGGAYHHHGHYDNLHHEPIIEVPAEEPLDTNAHYAVLNFIIEDRIFLKAALDLLNERDRTAPELGMMDPIVLKSGSLKKASHLMNGVWKVKFVEIRRGMFSYYENVTTGAGKSHQKETSSGTSGGTSGEAGPNKSNTLLRKDIPLTSSCRCRAVKLHQKALKFTPTGAIFEISYGNNNKRLWMAKTRADRQMWMQTIQNAIVGGSVTRGQESFFADTLDDYDNNAAPTNNLLGDSAQQQSSHNRHGSIVWGMGMGSGGSSPRQSPFRDDMRKFQKAHTTLRNAKNRQDYVVGLRMILAEHSLKVPVKWIASKQGLAGGGGAGGAAETMEVAFREDTVELSVDQLFKDLQRDSVTINGELFRGDAGHGSERIVGALARELMEVGRRRNGDNGMGSNSDLMHGTAALPLVGRSSDYLKESQALAYARDILLSGSRTRSGGDSYFCVNTLCSNQELVVVVPSGKEAEPIGIEVVEDESDVGFVSGVIEKSGWIKTRNKSQKEWKKLFFVLSEGTLSFYENALPRPHKLLGQIVLTDATISVSKIEAEPDKKVPAQYVLTLSREGSTRERYLLFGSEDRLLDWTYAVECTSKMKANADAARRSARRRSMREEDTPSSKLAIISQAEQSTKDHATNLGLDDEIVESRIAGYARRTASAIVISIRACTEYKVCTLDPQGDEREDTWATIRAHFLQSFRVTGGPNGRILRGEEVVRVSVVDCIDSNEQSQETIPDDPGSPRRSGQRRIFRRFSTSDETDEAFKQATAED